MCVDTEPGAQAVLVMILVTLNKFCVGTWSSSLTLISLSDQNWCPVPIRASGQVQPAAEVSLGLGQGIHHPSILLLLWGTAWALPSQTPAGHALAEVLVAAG